MKGPKVSTRLTINDGQNSSLLIRNAPSLQGRFEFALVAIDVLSVNIDNTYA